MTLMEIKAELPKLTVEEQMELAAALQELNSGADSLDAWDLQMREDCKPGGKLDRMFKETQAKFERGECLPGFP